MGLTIHYTLRWTPSDPPSNDASARSLVTEARRQIVRAGLGRVTPLQPAHGGPFGGEQYVCVDREEGRYIDVPPAWGRLFTLEVGQGCDSVVLGLCRYPAKIRQHDREWRTGLPGWRLSAFAKTQYASVHGWEHFRRCHLAVIAALAIWRDLGARVKILDEGRYWPHRSERNLRRELDQMNGLVAGLAGALKDAADNGGPSVQSPIFAHPQFERLEADGIRQHGSKITAAAAAIRR